MIMEFNNSSMDYVNLRQALTCIAVRVLKGCNSEGRMQKLTNMFEQCMDSTKTIAHNTTIWNFEQQIQVHNAQLRV